MAILKAYGLEMLDERVNSAFKQLLALTEEREYARAVLTQSIRKYIAREMKRVANSAGVPVNKSGLSEAVQHGAFKTKLGGSVRITDAKKRGSKRREYNPGTERPRTVSARTRQINSYYGVDRAFILRMLNSGTDVRTAKAVVHGRGTGATWGARGNITGKHFFDRLQTAMDGAAENIAKKIEYVCTDVLDKAFKD